MNKSGGYTWIQTCATVVCNSKNAEEQNVICVNYVLSAREYGHLVMDCCQLENTNPTIKRETGQDPENGSPDADQGGKKTSSLKTTRRESSLVIDCQIHYDRNLPDTNVTATH